MSPLQEVHTGFTFNFDGSKLAAIQRGVGRATTNLNTIAAKTDIFQQRMGGMLQRAKQIVGVYLGFRAVKGLTVDFANAADATGKTAEGLGITVEQLSALKFVAASGGIEITQLGNAMGKLSRRASEAAKGSKENKKIFDDMGISVHDQNGELKSSFDLLLDVSNRFKSMKQGSDKTRLALKLFEETGARFVNTMNLGADGIKGLMEEAKRLGVVLSAEGAKKAAAFNDAMLRVKSIVIGVRNSIALKLLPAITDSLNAFQKWWKEGRNAERALRALKLVAIFTGIVIARLIGASVLRNVKMFVQGIWAGVQALRAMGTAAGLAQIKIWAIIAAFALIALAVEDLIGFAMGKDSVIGRILGDTKLADDLRKALIGLGKDAAKAWKDLKPALLDAWKALEPALRRLGVAIKPLAGPGFKIAIQSMIVSVKLLTFGVSLLAFAINHIRKGWEFVGTTGTAIAESLTIAWEDVTEAIAEAWEDLKKTINVVATALGFDLSAAATLVSKAWDIALGGITAGFDKVVAGAKIALAWLGAVTGLTKQASALAAGIKASVDVGARVQAPLRPSDFAPGGQFSFGALPSLPGGPITGRAGLGMGPVGFGARAPSNIERTVITTAVAAGAVQLTVQAGGNPQEVALAVNALLQKNLSKIITDASRDIVKPPRGQR